MPKKPGPKLERGTEKVAAVTLSLDSMTRRKAKVIGQGNESAGVREAVRAEYKRLQSAPD